MAPVDHDEQHSSAMTAHLHPRRGPGVTYLSIAVVVGVIVLLGLIGNVSSGQFRFAAILTIVGLLATVIMGWLGLAILVPRLDVDGERITGRIGVNKTVNLDWSEVVVDIDDDSPRGQFRLDLGEASITIDLRSWDGFSDFVILVASTPVPARRLTPVARSEVARLLQLGDSAPPVDPESAR